jgi:hypothetical protein
LAAKWLKKMKQIWHLIVIFRLATTHQMIAYVPQTTVELLADMEYEFWVSRNSIFFRLATIRS